MKILIVQLTRLGDIFLTYPTINGIFRSSPETEVHLLVREAYHSACVGLDARVKVHTLNSKKIFKPLFESDDIDAGLKELQQELSALFKENFDRILNLSFSPSSSWIVHYLASNQNRRWADLQSPNLQGQVFDEDQNIAPLFKSEVKSEFKSGAKSEAMITGYSRTSDGYLAIADDISAYFYAQVGPGRFNRYHLAEIFATQASLDLVESDWHWPKNQSEELSQRKKPLLGIHVGASQQQKQVAPEVWASLISQPWIREKFEVLLLGGPSDQGSARTIMASTTHESIRNLTGAHSFVEVAEWIRQCQILVAPDSSLVHLASLVGTPTIQVTHSINCFWETGPRASGSKVVEFTSSEAVHSSQILKAIMLSVDPDSVENQSSLNDCRIYQRILGTPSYQFQMGVPETSSQQFAWQLIKAIYQGEALPMVTEADRAQALLNLLEVNQVATDVLQNIKNQDDLVAQGQILDQVEQVIASLARIVPEVSPLVAWYQTEKVRIGPGDFESIKQQTLGIHENLVKFLILFGEDDSLKEHGEAPSF